MEEAGFQEEAILYLIVEMGLEIKRPTLIQMTQIEEDLFPDA